MRLLRDKEVHGYCQGDSAAGLQEELLTAGTWPALIVPLFEICRAVHFGARAGLAIGHFRDCWQKLVAWHYEQASDGYLLGHLAIEEDEDSLFQEIYFQAKLEPLDLEPDHELLDIHADLRNLVRDPRPFTACFRKLARLRMERLGKQNAEFLRWDNRWPEEIPAKDRDKRKGSGDLVLDTNLFVEILESLPINGWLDHLRPWQTPRVARVLAGAEKRFRESLLTKGRAGKLIIPAGVLIEAYGVIHSKAHGQYRNAQDVLRTMASQQDQWLLWNAFNLESFSLEVFGAFLDLHELLVNEVEDRHLWPDFPDAFVLAHALYNGCPVVSAEWVDKPECWAAVRAHYPFLHPGD